MFYGCFRFGMEFAYCFDVMKNIENRMSEEFGCPRNMDKRLESGGQGSARLRELVEIGVKSRWGVLSQDISDRLESELESIEQLGRTEYMLMVANVVAAIREAGGLISPGRGADGGSAVCYALGVSGVDPIKHGLLFERFMHTKQSQDATLVLIDTDAVGEKAALDALAKYGDVVPEQRQIYAPQYYTMNGWSIGITNFEPVNIVSSVLSVLKERGRSCPELDALPENDADTLDAFHRGDLAGLDFYDASNVQGVFRSLRKVTFDDIVNVGVFSYPGLRIKRSEFLLRRQGKNAVVYQHPLEERYLKRTFGIMAYQEQLLLLLARRLAGFTSLEAILLCKAFSKVLIDKQRELKPKFIDGCLANEEFRIGSYAEEGVARNAATEIWNEWERSARYCFLKSHQVCFARLAYQLIYLKAHYPVEWLIVQGKAGQNKQHSLR